LVSIDDSALDPMAELTDLGFTNSDLDIRAMQFLDGSLYLLGRFSSTDFTVFVGTETGGPWEQLGQVIVESPTHMWVDGNSVFILVNREDVTDVECRMLPVSAGPDALWASCGGNLEVKSEEWEKPYSTLGKFVGDSSHTVLWTRIEGMDDGDVLAFHSLDSDGLLSWAGQAPMALPASWTYYNESVLLGYVGTEGGGGAVIDRFDLGADWELSLEGLPAAKDKFSGVVGMCPAGGKLYVLYLDYSSTDSKLFVYQDL